VCLSCEQARCLAVAPIALGKLLGDVAWGDLLEPSTEGAAMHESLTVALFAAGRNVCGVQGVHLKLPGPLPMHLHTAYVEYYECLPTLLDPLAERTCFSQVRGTKGLRRDARHWVAPVQ